MAFLIVNRLFIFVLCHCDCGFMGRCRRIHTGCDIKYGPSDHSGIHCACSGTCKSGIVSGCSASDPSSFSHGINLIQIFNFPFVLFKTDSFFFNCLLPLGIRQIIKRCTGKRLTVVHLGTVLKFFMQPCLFFIIRFPVGCSIRPGIFVGKIPAFSALS